MSFYLLDLRAEQLGKPYEAEENAEDEHNAAADREFLYGHHFCTLRKTSSTWLHSNVNARDRKSEVGIFNEQTFARIRAIQSLKTELLRVAIFFLIERVIINVAK